MSNGSDVAESPVRRRSGYPSIDVDWKRHDLYSRSYFRFTALISALDSEPS
jgi:hypothetical protein